mgnify:CR=1 FL=1
MLIDTTLATDYPSLWKLWLDRIHDVSILVRIERIQLSEPFYENVGVKEDMRKQINETLADRLLDPEDRIRLTVCSLISKIASRSSSTPKLFSKRLLEGILERCRDRKVFFFSSKQ